MKRSVLWASTMVLGVAAAVAGAQAKPDLVVHEWGTFLAMQGSDGISLDGLYHEEHALPGFVHARSADQLRMPRVFVKGETPVIYFYTDRPQRVNVSVDFPTGIWTQWYPQANQVAPRLTQTASPAPKNGFINWSAWLTPGPAKGVTPPPVAEGALWAHARAVPAAANVTTGEKKQEHERFLFYRGLGTAPLPLTMSAENGGALRWTDPTIPAARHLFVLRVEKGRGVYRYLPNLGVGAPVTEAIPSMAGARPVAEFSARLADGLAARLVDSGLYPDEARAMVNTWRSSYFHTEGIRTLFILPAEWTDRTIPLRVQPQPGATVRVMVGRLELLTPEREQLAEAAVRNLASTDPAVRERAFDYLKKQGRYVEPILKRVSSVTEDERVRALCKRLLLTHFVTELRAASNEPVNGDPLVENFTHVRAQLASLLREVGLQEEAAAEARKALAVLNRAPEPPMNKSGSRHYFRAMARAVEGAGDDVGAAQRYAAFIRFAGQAKTESGCRGCHTLRGAEGPRDMTFFPGWWAGRRYAEIVRRSRRMDAAVREAEVDLARGRDEVAARLKLAYLYERVGKRDRAGGQWAALGAVLPRTAAR